MATPEEKQETIDTLKGPRYYRLLLTGYGGESAYINISKEAYEFWNNIVDEYGDSDLVTYIVDAQDAEGEHFDFEDIDGVPAEADFMKDEEDNYSSWYEHHSEYVHQYGVEYGSAYLSVDEVNSSDYMSNHIAEVISGENLSDLMNTLSEEVDYEIDFVESDEDMDGEGDYVVQMYSSEKGSFWDGIIETVGEFDPKKLRIVITEYPNGEDIVTSITYDGVEVENQGGDTNGKGYSAHVWSNVD